MKLMSTHIYLKSKCNQREKKIAQRKEEENEQACLFNLKLFNKFCRKGNCVKIVKKR